MPCLYFCFCTFALGFFRTSLFLSTLDFFLTFRPASTLLKQVELAGLFHLQKKRDGLDRPLQYLINYRLLFTNHCLPKKTGFPVFFYKTIV